MNQKMIETDVPEPKEQPAVRLKYNLPILEEYGNLHNLTHGVGGDADDGGGSMSSPFGIVGP